MGLNHTHLPNFLCPLSSSVTSPCQKTKFILCCPYTHQGMVKFLMASSSREFFSACICSRSHQVRSSVQWSEPSRVSSSASCHHLHHRAVGWWGVWGVGLLLECSRHSTGGVVGGGQFPREGRDQLSPKGWGQLSYKSLVPPLLCPQHHWHYQPPCAGGAGEYIHFLYSLIGWLLGWFCILTIVNKPYEPSCRSLLGRLSAPAPPVLSLCLVPSWLG